MDNGDSGLDLRATRRPVPLDVEYHDKCWPRIFDQGDFELGRSSYPSVDPINMDVIDWSQENSTAADRLRHEILSFSKSCVLRTSHIGIGEKMDCKRTTEKYKLICDEPGPATNRDISL